MKRTPTRRAWLTALGAACVLCLLLVDGTLLSESAYAQRARGGGARMGGARMGGARMGGAHRMHAGGGRYRGSTRGYSRGSVRYHRSNPVRRSYTRGSGRSRHSGAYRSPTRRAGSDRRAARSRTPITRTPQYGSINRRSDVSRSLAERSRARQGDERRSLRDMTRPGREEGRRPGERPPGWEERREELRDRIQERRDELSDGAIWYGRYGYYWDAYAWWEPYYVGDDVIYVEVYPSEPVEITELPEDAVEIVTEDGETLYTYNGIYYRRTEGGFVVVPEPAGIDIDPVTIVRRACDFLREQPAMVISLRDSMDHVQDSGQKLMSHATRTIQLSRPDQLAARAQGDDLDRELWFDGETVTIVDRLENIYAQTSGPSSNDEMLDFLVEQLSVSLPLIDWFYSDPYASIVGALSDGEYLGLMDVAGASCHHLSFSVDDADWELWVDAGTQPVPRRMAITYTSVPEHPTYTAWITAWQGAPEIGEDTFTARIPDGAKEIPFSTPEEEITRLKEELEALREKHRRVDDYVAAQKTIELYSQIAEKPEAAARIATEQERLASIGDVPQSEIDDYLARKQSLQAQIREARRAARDP